MEKYFTIGEKVSNESKFSFSISYIDHSETNSESSTTSNTTTVSSTSTTINTNTNNQPQLQAPTINLPPCPYDHLVLVVHGVGDHSSDKSSWNKTIKKMNKTFCKIFYNLETQNFDKRVKFIGTEWHSSIHTALGTTISDVTPKIGIPAVRAIIDDTVMDFLMFSTPKYAEPIYKEVTDQLNSEYNAFIKEYPNFNGKVSILGHSLGSIIVYDLLTNQPNNVSSNNGVDDSCTSSNGSSCINNSSSNSSDDLHGNNEHQHAGNISLWRKIKGYEEETKEVFHSSLQFTPLDFPVSNFYIIGSPVGALLSLRKHSQVPIPKCTNLYNIYNIYDPIAYLIEPLIDKRYLSQDIQYLPKFTKKLNKLPKKFRSSKKIDDLITNKTPNTSSQSSPCLLSAQQAMQNISITPTSATLLSVAQQTQIQLSNSPTISASATSNNGNDDSSSSSDGDEEDDDDDSGDTTTSSSISSSNTSEFDEKKLKQNKDDINLFAGFRYDYAMKPKFHITELVPMLTAHSSYFLSKEVLSFIGLNLN